MIRLSNPEDESRTLINSRAIVHKSIVSVDEEEQNFLCAHLNYSDIRYLMPIESADEDKSDKYIKILCNLFDESVQFNESRSKVKTLVFRFVFVHEISTKLELSRKKAQGTSQCTKEIESVSRPLFTSSA